LYEVDIGAEGFDTEGLSQESDCLPSFACIRQVTPGDCLSEREPTDPLLFADIIAVRGLFKYMVEESAEVM
jgi:hypothetical protein